MTCRSSWSWRSGSRSCITARSSPKARRQKSSRTRGCWKSISRHERRSTAYRSHSGTARRAGPGMTAASTEDHPQKSPLSAPLLQVEDIHTYYGKSHILHGVSLEVGRGEVVGLLGRNGVGKSTTLKAIAGLIHPSAGRVVFEGRAITNLPSHRLARLGIGYVPEDRRVFPLLTVTENLRTRPDRPGV